MTPTNGIGMASVGDRIVQFRKARNLTQVALADRYKVSAPAIFKFEKGFISPSLKLWLKMAADMGIPEREAVLTWVRDRLPEKHRKIIPDVSRTDPTDLKRRMQKHSNGSESRETIRDLILNHPDISPSLKAFLSEERIWKILQLSADEMEFLIDLDRRYPRISIEQFREAVLCGREIQAEN